MSLASRILVAITGLMDGGCSKKSAEETPCLFEGSDAITGSLNCSSLERKKLQRCPRNRIDRAEQDNLSGPRKLSDQLPCCRRWWCSQPP
ncbi:hypothetical protein MTP99_017376 [Tenebrio molitor]|nr:hypothetical protein MTP99_017376 [Tenebrio molitor]